MNYQSTFTLSPAVGAAGTWAFDMSLLPHPISFLYYKRVDSVGTAVGNFNNTQVAGATSALKYTAFKELFQRWRLAYLAVTCYQDGADLANQGTIVVSQPPVKPRCRKGASHSASQTLVSADVVNYSAEDFPDFDNSQSMPNAYFSRSRDGAYVPLKLTRTCQSWQSEATEVFHTGGLGASGTDGLAYLPTSTGVCDYPITDLVRRFDHYTAGALDALGGDVTSAMCNDTFAHICAKNLAVTTSFTFFVRAGFEVQCAPGTVMAPHLKLSPEYDHTALKAYFAIARELKDAYPADYNDLGKIWDVISSAAKAVAPALSMIPGVGPILSGVVPMAASIGDQIRNAVSNSNQTQQPTAAVPVSSKVVGRTASQADVDRAKQAVTDATTRRVRLINVRRTRGVRRRVKSQPR